MKVGVVGASGYTGAELLRICAGHPEFEVVLAGADTQAGRAVGDLYPSLAIAYPDLQFTSSGPGLADDLQGLDVVFFGLPHGQSQKVIPDLVGGSAVLIDLAADFRLKDPGAYPVWYKEEHTSPELLERFVYGLPEINREQIKSARLIAAAGCYPTAATLGLAPLVKAGAIEASGVIVDAASGLSGSGRKLTESSHFAAADENFVAYGLLDHRHTPEIEQATGAQVLFTPHLAPMTRGILATCYVRPSRTMSTAGLLEILASQYEDEPFVHVSEVSPSTKSTYGSNSAFITARVDERTGWAVVFCAIDNLVKGASGQAVQCANLALGIPETTGLSSVGVYP